MKALLIIISVIIILIAISLFVKVKARLFMMGANGKKFNATLTINFLWKKIDIPIVGGDKKDKKENSDDSTVEKTDKTEEKKNIIEKLDGICKLLEKSHYVYVMSRKALKKRITFENIYFALTFGLEDAAMTGIATGSAWGVVYNLFALLCRISNVKNHKFNITPDFEKECYDLVFEGILTLSLANIICICAVIYRNYRKACRVYDA